MGKSQTRAKNKYNAKTYDRITVTVKKGVKDIWRAEAERQGLSLNAFIEKAVDLMMNPDSGIDYPREENGADTEILCTKEQIVQIPSENDILDNVILTITDSCRKLLSAHCRLIDLYPYNKNDEDSGEIKSPYNETIKEYLLAIMSEDIYRLRMCVNDDMMKKDVKNYLGNLENDMTNFQKHADLKDLEKYLREFNKLMGI